MSGSVQIFLISLLLKFAAANNQTNVTESLLDILSESWKHLNSQMEAEWNFETNINSETEFQLRNVSTENAKFWKKASEFVRLHGSDKLSDEIMQQQSQLLIDLGTSSLNPADSNELSSVSSAMQSNFANVTVCDFANRTKCDIPLEPDLVEIFATKRNPEELKYYWRQFQDKAATPLRNLYAKYIELSNKAAKLNNVRSAADKWLEDYGENFILKMDLIYSQILPLYTQIHAYVRHRLRRYYGKKLIPHDGAIPMHLLGDIFGTSWSKIFNIIKPFPEKQQINITSELIRQGYTARKMFQKGEEFFTSMNFSRLSNKFWDKSILERPNDNRQMICHPSAWSFYRKNDVRIRQCTQLAHDDFLNLHHELGHIFYFLQYQHLPIKYQSAPNTGFHEAIGDLISLSVSTPKHLSRIGLLQNYTMDPEERINRLLLSALLNVVSLPFALAIDRYRFALIRGEIDKRYLNSVYWSFRLGYCGLRSPVKRNENDFDLPSLFHVIVGSDLIRYFVSFVLQYQFYKSACRMAGQYDANNSSMPLDNCDIYGSVEVGNALRSMMSMGSTKSWPDLLEAFTGERKIDGAAMAEYYEPLRAWLERENAKDNVTLGWTL